MTDIYRPGPPASPKDPERRCSCGAGIDDLPPHFKYCRDCYDKLQQSRRETAGPAKRACGCGAPIDELPAHFRHCRDCYRALKGEARFSDEDFWDGAMERLLSGID